MLQKLFSLKRERHQQWFQRSACSCPSVCEWLLRFVFCFLIISVHWRLFTSGQHLSQLSIFPWGGRPSNLPRYQRENTLKIHLKDLKPNWLWCHAWQWKCDDLDHLSDNWCSVRTESINTSINLKKLKQQSKVLPQPCDPLMKPHRKQMFLFHK